MAIQFLFNNLADTSTTLITSTSAETNFPDVNIINTDRNNPWKTPTAGGFFNITAGNSFIDIKASDGSLTSIQMSISTYSLGSLKTEIQNKLNAASADTFNVTFSSNFIWEIQGSASLTILWQSGANAANNIGSILGYDISANDSTTTGTLTGDNRAIHTNEFVQFDLGSAQTVSTVAIIDRLSDGIQIQTTANSGTVRWQGSDTEAFTSLTVDITLATQSGQYVTRPTLGSGTAPSARHWRALISDPKNSNGFVQLGYISFGVPFEPTSTGVDPSWVLTNIDPSPVQKALGGQKYFDKRDHMRSTRISLPLMSNADHDQLQTIFSITGIANPFFLLIDPTLSVSNNTSELTIFGRFEDDLEFRYAISDLYNLEFDFEEAL